MNKEFIITDGRVFDSMINKSRYKYNKNYTIYKREADACKFGIAVPKKIAGAVTRNKIKRQIKEIIRTNKEFFLYNNEYIIIVKKNILELSFSEMQSSLEELFRQFNKEK